MATSSELAWHFAVDPPDELVDAVRQGLITHNIARAAIDQSETLGWFLRDGAHRLVGGIVGDLWGECVEINFLWLEASLRGQGLGRALLERFERGAQERGARLAVLDTFDFQAPAFYHRLGYRLVAEIEGYPDGHRKLFYRKALGGDRLCAS